MNLSEIRIRPFQSGDRAQVRALREATFGWCPTEAGWSWQFEQHPAGLGWATVAEHGDQIIGFHGMMRQHLNFLGRELVAAQECDAMIRPEARGQGLYSRVALAAYDRAVRESGLRAVFAFPSRNSFPGSYPMLIRHLGSVRITNLYFASIRLGWRRIVGPADIAVKVAVGTTRRIRSAVTRRLAGAGLTFGTSATFPADLDELLKHVRDYEVLAVWKDLPYLKWRYEVNADKRYDVHVLRKSGEAHGLVVARLEPHRVTLCEIIDRRKNVAFAAALLRYVVEYYAATSAQVVESYGFDNGFFGAALESAGFDVVPFSKIILTGRSFGEDRLTNEFPLAQNWTIARGDTDAI